MKNIVILILVFVFAVGCKSQKTTTSTDKATTEKSKRTAGQGNKGGPPSIDDIFKMDNNNDGKLSKTELKGPLLNDFAKIDTDGDGFISRTELEQAPKPQRGQRPNRNN